eukprot:GCRY01000754.1.p1 GENE.GCRY01000754.1~~GCRY01000754.1.p1  ORF type:complete len:132 (+),score=15.42 GCRY01000754.1:39-434(+)
MSVSKIIFNVFNLIVAALVGIDGVIRILDSPKFQWFVIAVFIVIFALFILIIELAMPHLITQYMLFTCNWFGRAFFYLFLGFMVVGEDGFDLVAGVIVIVISIVWFVMYFIRVYPFPGPILGGANAPAAGV